MENKVDEYGNERPSLFEIQVALAVAKQQNEMGQRITQADALYAAMIRAHGRPQTTENWCWLF